MAISNKKAPVPENGLIYVAPHHGLCESGASPHAHQNTTAWFQKPRSLSIVPFSFLLTENGSRRRGEYTKHRRWMSLPLLRRTSSRAPLQYGFTCLSLVWLHVVASAGEASGAAAAAAAASSETLVCSKNAGFRMVAAKVDSLLRNTIHILQNFYLTGGRPDEQGLEHDHTDLSPMSDRK